jgi:F0F1-type ATP synthase membrane subunit c/vacuolar-type H+-ATPase subunit K
VTALLALLSGRRPALVLGAAVTVTLAGVGVGWWLDRAVERGIDTMAGAE